MKQEKWEARLELLRRGRLELASAEGEAALKHMRGTTLEAHQMLEALIAGVRTLQRKNTALQLLCENMGRAQKQRQPRRTLEFRWRDGSVSQTEADGYEIEVIGDREYVVPFRLERVDEEPVSMTDEWASVCWVTQGRSEQAMENERTKE